MPPSPSTPSPERLPLRDLSKVDPAQLATELDARFAQARRLIEAIEEARRRPVRWLLDSEITI